MKKVLNRGIQVVVWLYIYIKNLICNNCYRSTVKHIRNVCISASTKTLRNATEKQPTLNLTGIFSFVIITVKYLISKHKAFKYLEYNCQSVMNNYEIVLWSSADIKMYNYKIKTSFTLAPGAEGSG